MYLGIYKLVDAMRHTISNLLKKNAELFYPHTTLDFVLFSLFLGFSRDIICTAYIIDGLFQLLHPVPDGFSVKVTQKICNKFSVFFLNQTNKTMLNVNHPAVVQLVL